MGATRSKHSYRPGGEVSSSKDKNYVVDPPKVVPDDLITQTVGSVDEIGPKGMKTFAFPGLEGAEVLVVRKGDEFYALGSKCTHYGAKLENGTIGDDCVRCPWHGASFCLKTGDIEDFPGTNNLPAYKVKVENSKIIVSASKAALIANKRPPLYATVRPKKMGPVFIVVGGGPAGFQCVSSLREFGFTGRIIFVLAENVLPYDRIKLSKSLSIDVNSILLRPEEFYKERNIEIMKGRRATALDASKRIIKLDNTEELKFDKVFIATGSSARMPEIPGNKLKNVFTLRYHTDKDALQGALSEFKAKNEQCHVVILGASFIGLEVASVIRNNFGNCVVQVICDAAPFSRLLGPEISGIVTKLIEGKGVKLYTGNTITEIKGNSQTETVVLRSGEELKADIVVLAAGAVPNTDLFVGSGIELRKDKTVLADQTLQAAENVFVGGDIAYAPVLNYEAAIGHIGVAQYHGKVAAGNMLGFGKSLKTAPFFWTSFFGQTFRYAGFAPEYDQVEIDGDLENFKFSAYYVKNGEKLAILTCGKDPLAAEFLQKLMDSRQKA